MAKSLKSMFKSKTAAKILAGMGLAVAVPMAVSYVAPGLSPNLTRGITAMSGYLLGGVETVIGSLVPMFVGGAMREQPQSGAGLTSGGTL